jgi:hypothetical protein
MRKFRSILVLCALLDFGVSLVVPAADVSETAFDESETLPYLTTSMYSIVVPKAIVAWPAVQALVPPNRLGSLRRLGEQSSDRGTGRAYLLCDSLALLEHSLRC